MRFPAASAWIAAVLAETVAAALIRANHPYLVLPTRLNLF